jgi:hypothetical protein
VIGTPPAAVLGTSRVMPSHANHAICSSPNAMAPPNSAGCFSVLDSYIYGFGRQQFSISVEGVSPEEMAEMFLAAIPVDEYPYLNHMAMQAMQTGYEADADADFGFGLEVILDGLEKMLAVQTES